MKSQSRHLVFLILVLCVGPLNGQIQTAWVAKYNNGITTGSHQAQKMLLDSTGSVYVSGFSQNTNDGIGYATLKYSPNGQQIWGARFESTNPLNTQPTSIALDSQGGVIVTGTAATVKYDKTGILLWQLPYNAAAVATDLSNNVYLTGINTNFLTMKFSSQGSNLWSQTYATAYAPTIAQVISVNAMEEAYVAGYGFDQPPVIINRTATVVVKYGPTGNQLWVEDNNAHANGAAQFMGSVLDELGTIYLAFNLYGPSTPYTTYAYSSQGSSLWANFDPTLADNASCRGLAMGRGRIAITGETPLRGNAGTSLATFGISTNGSYLWTNLYPKNPQQASGGNAITSDSSGDFFVTGYTPEVSGTNDIVTIAYDTNGKQLWLQLYTGLGYGAVGNAIAADNAGNIYVAGYENVPGGGSEMILIKYSPVTIQHQSNGNFLLQAQGSPSEPFDIQASTNLQSWLDLGPQSADTNGLLQYLDTNAPLYPWRFYLAIPQ